MTVVSPNAAPVLIPGNGSAVIFAAPLKVFAASDVLVGFVVNGAYTLQTSGYTVSNIDIDSGCTVTFIAPPPVGTTVDIRTQTPQTQGTNFANLGSYAPESTTDTVDRIVRQVQDLTRQAYTFGIHGPDQESIVWPALPAPPGRAGLALMFDSNGLPTLGTPVAGTLTQELVTQFLGLDQTEAEITANVIPLNTAYQPLDPLRYGAVGDGLTDDTVAMTNWAQVLNADGAPVTSLWSNGKIFLCGPLPTITRSDVTINMNGCTVLVKPNSWPSTVVHLNFTGSRINLYAGRIDGNQANFASQQTGFLLVLGSHFRMVGISIVNSSLVGFQPSNMTQGTAVACHFDNNANVGAQLSTCSDVRFYGCTFNQNGYGFQGSYNIQGPVGSGTGIAVRFRCHHLTFSGCEFNQNGIEGVHFDQGSYALKCIGCIAWGNNDGGFTLNADSTSVGTPGDGESCYDVEYVDCEAYNNWSSGLVAYEPAFNITVQGGRYYNNGRFAGLQATVSAGFNGIYFAAGSAGIVIRTKSYDDRQLTGVMSASGGTPNVLAVSNWTPGTKGQYPIVALYNSSYVFQGYAAISAEGTNSVSLVTVPNQAAPVSSIGSSWIVSQRVQHNGVFIDTGGNSGSVASVEIDGFGFQNGPQPYMGWKVMSGYNGNNQNVLRPDLALDYTELIANPTFDTNLTSWTFNLGAGGSDTQLTSGNIRSAGALQLVGGSSAVSVANTSSGMIASYLNYVNQGSWVEAGIWAYSIAPGGALFQLVYNPGSGLLTSTVNHPGGGWRQLKIGAYVPASITALYVQVVAAVAATAVFDTAYCRVKAEGYDNRDFAYPTRNLPV
jgi:Right handed beta helix region